jgi:hypothetical protein
MSLNSTALPPQLVPSPRPRGTGGLLPGPITNWWGASRRLLCVRSYRVAAVGRRGVPATQGPPTPPTPLTPRRGSTALYFGACIATALIILGIFICGCRLCR